MENKKLGIILIILAFLVGGLLFYYNSQLIQKSQDSGCFSNPNCAPIEKELSVNHFAVGIFSFILALGFYLLFFNKTEKAILKKLEQEKEKNIQEEKFKIILSALDDYEKRIMKVVKEQDGITQNTLMLRTNMSKSKLSYVLQELEKRNLIKRIKKGKTLAVFLKI